MFANKRNYLKVELLQVNMKHSNKFLLICNFFSTRGKVILISHNPGFNI